MKLDRNLYLSHISSKEKLIEMRKIIDKIEIVMNKHTIESSDFLDPYDRYLAKSILNRFIDISYLEDGGFEGAERKIILIFPSYTDPMEVDRKLVAIRIKGDLDKLSHKDFLGSLLGLGIVRNKTGDILVHKDYGDIVLKEEVGNFVFLNLEKIGNEKVYLEEIPLDSLHNPYEEYDEFNRFLSSYRLDVYISSAYNMSRKDSMDLIRSGRVKLNWEPTERPDREVNPGDVISIRGFGRSIFYKDQGLSKKDKIKAIIRIIK